MIYFYSQPLAWQTRAGYENTCGVSDHYGTWLMLTPRSNFHVVAASRPSLSPSLSHISDLTPPVCR